MNSKPLLVGVTGGIGSGKTTVCSILQNMAYPVFYADIQSKILCDTNPTLKASLIDAFGSGVYNSFGLLDRPALASIIFSDTQKLHQANQIIHPIVRQAFQTWVLEQDTKLVFLESAILLESELQHSIDKVLLVSATEPVRIARVMKRDGLTQEQVLARLQKQMPEQERIKKAHYIIQNDNNELLIPQVEQIVKELICL